MLYTNLTENGAISCDRGVSFLFYAAICGVNLTKSWRNLSNNVEQFISNPHLKNKSLVFRSIS